MTVATCICGATWTGTKVEHCPACHESFPGTTLGDAHRVGPFPDGRRCLTVEEMTAKGWTRTAKGSRAPVWHGPAPENPRSFPARVFSETPDSPSVAPVTYPTRETP